MTMFPSLSKQTEHVDPQEYCPPWFVKCYLDAVSQLGIRTLWGRRRHWGGGEGGYGRSGGMFLLFMNLGSISTCSSCVGRHDV